MNAAAFRRLALALPDTTEAPHFDRAAFRTPRRIFTTLAADGASANLKLEPEHQALLVAQHPAAFQPVSGGWGRMGWTVVTLAAISAAELKGALAIAHGLAQPPAKKPKKALSPPASRPRGKPRSARGGR
jgi:hypothetical protein